MVINLLFIFSIYLYKDVQILKIFSLLSEEEGNQNMFTFKKPQSESSDPFSLS